MKETRNTPVLKQIVEFLPGLLFPALTRDVVLYALELRFGRDYLLIAGNIQTVEEAAKDLRLDISKEECAQVLDYIAKQAMVSITIENVETAAYALFGNRFIEPYGECIASGE